MRGHVEGGFHRERVLRWGLYAAVVVLNLVQQPGRITFDTKLDLQIDPAAFLGRSLQLWNPDSTLGELQNQASGYAFPLGPLYLLGQVLHVPMWVWERGISAMVMVLAFEGMRRLALAWGGIATTGAWLAGLFYMLSPRLLSTVGALTGEALPSSVLPWTVLPLVLCLRGRVPLRRAVLLSVATIPFMGGQNATEVIAALALPGVLLVVNTHPWRTRARLAGAWLAGAVLVSLWWLVPLLLLGRYGSPFLDYIESARATTDRIGWLASLRGTDHWVTFLALGDSSSWRAGLELTSSRILLVSTVTAATVGLVGLMSDRLPQRRSLIAALVVGLFALTAGSTGIAGSVLDGPWTALLDGPLAAFRNVHKFDPVVRVPLALGFAAAVDAVRSLRVRQRLRRRSGVVAVLATGLLTLAVAAASVPLFQGHLRDSSGFTAIPDSWTKAAAYLEAQPGVVRSLVIPGSGFAVQTWGRTTDEPLQVLSGGAWSSRTQTPLMPAGTIRWLDQVEAVVSSARPNPDFARMLARAGITHLVVRNDLDYAHTDSPRPEVVHRLVDSAPGLLNVAHFGSSRTIYPAVEIYAVAPDGGDPRVRLYDAGDVATVVGGSEAADQLLANGVLDDERGMVRARGRDVRGADILTDSLQRVERNFGRVHEATSQVMTSTEPFRIGRAAHDYLYDDPGGQTVARYSGISEVLASSSAGYADTLGPILPEQGPYAAVDGSLLTSWVSAPFADPRGAWIELRFARPTVLGPISLQFDLQTGAGVREVAIDTDSGRRTASVDLDGRVSGLAMETAPTRTVRFTVLDSNKSIRPVKLQEISIGGVSVGRSLAVPGSAYAGTTMSFRSTVQRPACIAFYAGLACNAEYQRLSVDSSVWSRDVDVAESGSWLVSGSAVATGGDAVASLFAPLDPRRVRVFASSWFGGDPDAVPQNAFDGQPSTTWVSAATDRRPVLDLRWKQPRRITRIYPRLAPGAPGRTPDRLVVQSDAGTQVITLGRLGTGLIRPVRTTYLRLTLLRDHATAGGDAEPIGISELSVDGLEGLSYHADAATPTGSVCGFGPVVTVGDRTIPTQVRGTIGDVISGAPLELAPCGRAGGAVQIPRGPTRVTVRNAGAFAVRDLTLTPAAQPAAATSRSGSLVVTSWDSSRRAVRVDTGDAALLTVTQSLNPGWVATLRGTRLPPVEVDGWMQGWRVPANTRGTVELRFAPQVPYLVGLLGGLLVAFLVLAMAGWSLVRGRRAGPVLMPSGERGAWGRRASVALLVVLAVVSVPAAVGALLGLLLQSRSRRWSVGCLVLAATGAVLLTVPVLDTTLVAPQGADLLMALAFGIMAATMVTDDTTTVRSRHG
jgi:arabinofuranan 3-O-arabinosyltransferase